MVHRFVSYINHHVYMRANIATPSIVGGGGGGGGGIILETIN